MNDRLLKALELLRSVSSSDDLRWLRAFVALALGLRPNLRGIVAQVKGESRTFENYSKSPALLAAHSAVSSLGADDLKVVYLVVDLLYERSRPLADDASRGKVQIKTLKKKYLEIDKETGLPVLDEKGREIWVEFSFPYAYIRVYAGKGDADRKRQRLLSIYADRGGKKEGLGRGGIVAGALELQLITEDDLLDAYHNGELPEFIDRCADLLRGMGGESSAGS